MTVGRDQGAPRRPRRAVPIVRAHRAPGVRVDRVPHALADLVRGVHEERTRPPAAVRGVERTIAARHDRTVTARGDPRDATNDPTTVGLLMVGQRAPTVRADARATTERAMTGRERADLRDAAARSRDSASTDRADHVTTGPRVAAIAPALTDPTTSARRDATGTAPTDRGTTDVVRVVRLVARATPPGGLAMKTGVERIAGRQRIARVDIATTVTRVGARRVRPAVTDRGTTRHAISVRAVNVPTRALDTTDQRVRGRRASRALVAIVRDGTTSPDRLIDRDRRARPRRTTRQAVPVRATTGGAQAGPVPIAPRVLVRSVN